MTHIVCFHWRTRFLRSREQDLQCSQPPPKNHVSLTSSLSRTRRVCCFISRCCSWVLSLMLCYVSRSSWPHQLKPTKSITGSPPRSLSLRTSWSEIHIHTLLTTGQEVYCLCTYCDDTAPWTNVVALRYHARPGERDRRFCVERWSRRMATGKSRRCFYCCTEPIHARHLLQTVPVVRHVLPTLFDR